MNKKGWCSDDFSDAAVPEKLFIIFFLCKTFYDLSKHFLFLYNDIDVYFISQIDRTGFICCYSYLNTLNRLFSNLNVWLLEMRNF